MFDPIPGRIQCRCLTSIRLVPGTFHVRELQGLLLKTSSITLSVADYLARFVVGRQEGHG